MSKVDELGAPEDDSWKVIAWVPSNDATVEELTARLKDAQRAAMLEREKALGLGAELAVARKELDVLAQTPLGTAFRRIDKLEERCEDLRHKLRLGAFGEELGDEIAALKSSATWRAGRIVIAPAIFLKARVRRK